MIDFKSTSGDIRVKCRESGQSDIELKSISGNIELELPEKLSADFGLESNSGKIKVDFKDKTLSIPAGDDDSSIWSYNKSMMFKIDTGDAVINIETLSGNITVR